MGVCKEVFTHKLHTYTQLLLYSINIEFYLNFYEFYLITPYIDMHFNPYVPT